MTVPVIRMLGPLTLILIYDPINALHLVDREFDVFVCVHCWDIGGDVWYGCCLFSHFCVVLHCLHYVVLFYLHYVIWIADPLNVLEIVQFL